MPDFFNTSWRDIMRLIRRKLSIRSPKLAKKLVIMDKIMEKQQDIPIKWKNFLMLQLTTGATLIYAN